jgi:hypothetical protein
MKEQLIVGLRLEKTIRKSIKDKKEESRKNDSCPYNDHGSALVSNLTGRKTAPQQVSRLSVKK